MRVLKARHEGCGKVTRLRVPATVPTRAVRRVQCDHCGERFEADVSGRLSLPRFDVALPSFDPSSRAWRLASVPVAAAAVIGGLLMIQGDGGSDGTAPPAAEAPAASTANPSAPLSQIPGEPTGGGAKATAEIVRGSHYSLALPDGWQKVDPAAGATFAAVAAHGDAEATLWIEEDASLEFPAFIEQSLNQMRTLTPNPEVCGRVPGPTPETTVVRLCAPAPANQASYEVVLRAAGPYRYYLALTLQPDAGREAADGLDLLANSMTPEVQS